MNLTNVLSLVIAAAAAATVQSQEPPVAGPLPMRYIEVCQIELKSPVFIEARLQGRGEYEATVNPQGAIEGLKFIGASPQADNMRRFLRLDQFESCVKRWSFGDGGNYRLRLEGGTLSHTWFITASQAGKSIRLMFSNRL